VTRVTDANPSRRDILRSGTQALIWAVIGGTRVLCSAGAAAAGGARFNILTSQEGDLLARFAEALVPGAAAAGCAHFVDYHLGVSPTECLLGLRYFDLPAPYTAFYRAGLAGLARVVSATASSHEWSDAIHLLQSGEVRGWTESPQPMLFYAAVRSDAIDSVYCTVEGFDRLGVPYLPHILPATKW
jgi:hypothetical protein